MSKDIFMADYSECENFDRNLSSIITYLDNILKYVNKGDKNIDEARQYFNNDQYECFVEWIRKHINNEQTRYSNFQREFRGFYTVLEATDYNLGRFIDRSLEGLQKNDNYDSYVNIISQNVEVSKVESLYKYLIENGVSEQKAKSLSAMAGSSAIELIKELSKMYPQEVKQKIKDIQEKANKASEELFLCDILELNDPVTYVDQLQNIVQKYEKGDGWKAVIEDYMLGRSIRQAKLDVKSLTGNIDKLNHEISTGRLGKTRRPVKEAEYYKLKALREERLGEIIKTENTETNIKSVTKKLGAAVKTAQDLKIVKDEYDNYTKNGYSLDECIVDGAITWTDAAISAKAGMKFGTKVGVKLGGKLVGKNLKYKPIATAAGGVLGFVGGGFLNLTFEKFVKPTVNKVYREDIRPIKKLAEDKINDVSDWWDSLWW